MQSIYKVRLISMLHKWYKKFKFNLRIQNPIRLFCNKVKEVPFRYAFLTFAWFSKPKLNVFQVVSNPPQAPSQPSVPFLSLNNGFQQNHKPIGSKICRWVMADNTMCGKAFSKLDSLRRHVNELHKGVRPFACNVCEKNYGRRDYLDRHLRTHDPENQKKKSVTGNLKLLAGQASAGK